MRNICTCSYKSFDILIHWSTETKISFNYCNTIFIYVDKTGHFLKNLDTKKIHPRLYFALVTAALYYFYFSKVALLSQCSNKVNKIRIFVFRLTVFFSFCAPFLANSVILIYHPAPCTMIRRSRRLEWARTLTKRAASAALGLLLNVHHNHQVIYSRRSNCSVY